MRVGEAIDKAKQEHIELENAIAIAEQNRFDRDMIAEAKEALQELGEAIENAEQLYEEPDNTTRVKARQEIGAIFQAERAAEQKRREQQVREWNTRVALFIQTFNRLPDGEPMQNAVNALNRIAGKGRDHVQAYSNANVRSTYTWTVGGHSYQLIFFNGRLEQKVRYEKLSWE